MFQHPKLNNRPIKPQEINDTLQPAKKNWARTIRGPKTIELYNFALTDLGAASFDASGDIEFAAKYCSCAPAL